MSVRLPKFTPGPWSITPLKRGAIVAISDPEESLLGLDVEGFAIFANQDDAVLAAAAPEMYEALQFLVHADHDSVDYDDAVALARRVLAKVKGRAVPEPPAKGGAR